jgi:hypothetical protein
MQLRWLGSLRMPRAMNAGLGRLAMQEEAIMKTRFMQNEFPHVRISRRTRKKVHRLAHSPAVRGIAAFVPALVAGVIAVRKIWRINEAKPN